MNECCYLFGIFGYSPRYDAGGVTAASCRIPLAQIFWIIRVVLKAAMACVTVSCSVPQVAERDDFEFLAPLIPTCIALAGTVYPPHEVT